MCWTVHHHTNHPEPACDDYSTLRWQQALAVALQSLELYHQDFELYSHHSLCLSSAHRWDNQPMQHSKNV
eukprot:COSAG01_NODE_6576_length_3598_cov_2250.243498_2_plen_70_part_00